ncbi:response regulator transcription factor [Eubacterium barkeri]|uniref:Response regulator receiver domain-containing protein n=1 Tax=Eubacterium barkeri TaxID=1528 RepID=A0A1H3GMV2_EUBBA|nr:response regulator transcription factor [Eubacterium barkeri]SDY03958.1 Response regulator receiver domain-containing protein [Eubacterium barkeri]
MAGKWRDFFKKHECIAAPEVLDQIRDVAREALATEEDGKGALRRILDILGTPWLEAPPEEGMETEALEETETKKPAQEAPLADGDVLAEALSSGDEPAFILEQEREPVGRLETEDEPPEEGEFEIAFDEAFDTELEEEPEPEVALEPMDTASFVGKHLLYGIGPRGEGKDIITLAETWGIQVDEAANGLKAVEIFSASEEGRYDGIVLEKAMFLMDGVTVAKCIRKLKHAGSRSVPIILASVTVPLGMDRMENAGVDVCIGEGAERELYEALKGVW